jgi:hypothetical protein
LEELRPFSWDQTYKEQKVKALYKTTAIIWTESDPSRGNFSLMDLPILSENEYVWCSSMKTVMVADPAKDREWNDTDFWTE